jgi:5-methylthioadenosine/S-adenosylhomocysteine deaminase
MQTGILRFLLGVILAVPVAGTRRPCDTLVVNAVVVTGDEANHVFAPGAVSIAAGRIVAVGPEDQVRAGFEGAERIDAHGRLLLPGFVNARVELATAAAGKESCRRVCRSLLESGTTTFVSVGGLVQELARAAEEAGLRAVLGPEIEEQNASEALRSAEAFLKTWKSSPRIIPAVAPASPLRCSWSTLEASRKLALRYSRPLLIEASGTKGEVDEGIAKWGRSPITYLNEIGFLAGLPACIDLLIRPDADPNMVTGVDCADKAVTRQPVPTLIAGGAYALEGERETLKSLGVAVTFVTVGAGSSSPLDYENDGVLWTLGAQGESADSLCLLDAIRALHGAFPALSGRALLRAATLSGARALGMGETTGSIETGKQADLVLAGPEGSAAKKEGEIDRLLAGLKGPSDISQVWVGGKRLYRRRP